MFNLVFSVLVSGTLLLLTAEIASVKQVQNGCNAPSVPQLPHPRESIATFDNLKTPVGALQEERGCCVLYGCRSGRKYQTSRRTCVDRARKYRCKYNFCEDKGCKVCERPLLAPGFDSRAAPRIR